MRCVVCYEQPSGALLSKRLRGFQPASPVLLGGGVCRWALEEITLGSQPEVQLLAAGTACLQPQVVGTHADLFAQMGCGDDDGLGDCGCGLFRRGRLHSFVSSIYFIVFILLQPFFDGLGDELAVRFFFKICAAKVLRAPA